MRVCEEQLVAALRQGRKWKGSNTECDADGTVRLHGNTIARVMGGTWQFNLCGWNTATTRSRINTIRHMLDLPGVTSIKHTPHIVGALGYVSTPCDLTPAQRRAHNALHRGQRVEIPTQGWFE